MSIFDDLAAIFRGSSTGEQAVKHPEIAATAANPVVVGANGGAAAAAGGLGGGKDMGNIDPDSLKELNKYIDYSRRVRSQNLGKVAELQPDLDQFDALRNYGDSRDLNSDMMQQEFAVDGGIGINSALMGLTDATSGYNRGLNSLNKGDAGALQNYLGANQGLLGDLQNQGWQNAASGGAGLDAQKDALARYGALTSPEVTAQERYMSELARRQQEQQERASRDAVMSDLGARGMRGSGAELTNMLGSQQLTGQNRTLAELGNRANAVGRSMQALQGYGNVAGSMRNSEDVMAQFNAQQGQAAKQWQAQQAAALEQAQLDATRTTNKGIGERKGESFGASKDLANAQYKGALDKYGMGQDTIDRYDTHTGDMFDRGKDVLGANMDYTNMWTGQSNIGANNVLAGRQLKAGTYSANNAAKYLADQDDGGLLGAVRKFSPF